MDVAAWLQDLGLERYVPAFRDNDIDAGVLPKLTAEDLISIGMTSVGHRRKLLDAIASLGMAVPAAVVTAPAPGAPAQVDGERRQLTVVFCDLVGSTALSTRHDPEDLRELIGGYHRAVSKTVGRFDGFVAKYMGDGVLIYFGYPQAHEDDAERAVRAGLAVIEAVGQLPARQGFGLRLGHATRARGRGAACRRGGGTEPGGRGRAPHRPPPGRGPGWLGAAFSEKMGGDPKPRLRYFCSPHHQDSALYPFIAQLERAAGFARDEPVEEKLGKLRALLAPGARDDDDIALLSELLSLPSSAADLNLSPQRKREKLFEALLDQLAAEARHRPVLMVFEDAHCIDPTSREPLDLTPHRSHPLPLLLPLTS